MNSSRLKKTSTFVLLAVLLAVLSLLALASTAFAGGVIRTTPQPPTNGLVGLWKFNEGSGSTVADSSGSGNSGTLTVANAFYQASPATGLAVNPVNQSFIADFTDALIIGSSSVDVGNPASLQLTGDMTISLWYIAGASMPADIGTVDFPLVSKSALIDGDLGYMLGISSDNGVNQIKMSVSQNGTLAQTAARYGGTSLVSDSQWHHISGVYNASAQTMHVYLDGFLDDGTLSGTVPTSVYNSATSFQIGTSTPLVLIDDVRVYNRTLSNGELRTLNLFPGSAASTMKPSDKIRDIRKRLGMSAVGVDGSEGNSVAEFSVDGSGSPFFVHSTSVGLNLRKCTSVLCVSYTTVPLTIPTLYAIENKTLVATSTYPLVAVVSGSAGNSSVYFVKCDDSACGTIATTTIFSNTNTSATRGLGFALANDNYPMFSYSDFSGGTVRYGHCTNVNCTGINLQDIELGNGYNTSVMAGSDSNPVLAYDISGMLHFARCSDVTCGNTVTVRNFATTTRSPIVIKQASDGFPLIFSNSNEYVMRATKCANISCSATSTTFILAGSTVDDFDVTIPASGLPIIAWVGTLDPSTIGMFLTRCLNASCTSYTTQTIYNGYGLSNYLTYSVGIKLGSQGFPVIMHYESTGTLYVDYFDEIWKYHRCSNAACVPKAAVVTKVGVAQVGRSTGLVGYWSFNGKDLTDKIYDLSGQGNHAYFYGGATSSMKKPGKVGQGVQFGNQVARYVDAGRPASLNDIAQKTLCSWIYPKSFGAAISDATIFSKYAADGEGWWFQLADDDVVQSLYYYQAFASNGNPGRWRTSAGSIQLNQWQHVCVTYDNGSELNNPIFYINGEATTTTEFATPSGSLDSGGTLNKLFIGNYQNDTTSSFDGKIDEARIYNRILTAAEVRTLYLSGK